MRCPKCKSTRTIKYGTRMTGKGRRQSYQCQKCGHAFTEKSKKRNRKEKS